MEQKAILILTHGRFGEALIQSAEMIVGDLENVQAISLLPEMSAEEYRDKVQSYLATVSGEVICLVDLFGGTPGNTIMILSREYPVSILSGVNLPMLLELYLNKDLQPTDKLLEMALTAMKESGKNITQLLKEQGGSTDGN